MSETPNTGIPYVPQNVLDPAAGINSALNHIDALLQTAVISMSLTAPPGSPADGDLYIVDAVASGAWAGQENNLARYVSEGDFWQFFTAGEAVNLVLNRADDGLYAFDGANWVPAVAGSVGSVVVQDSDSPATVIDPTQVIVFGQGLRITDLGGNVALVEAVSQVAEVVTESGTTRTALAGDAGWYVRFTSGSAKTYTFDDGNGYTKGQEFHGRNAGAGDLTIDVAGGMTIHPPAGGSNVVPNGGTFTVKIVSDAGDEADLFGVTETT